MKVNKRMGWIPNDFGINLSIIENKDGKVVAKYRLMHKMIKKEFKENSYNKKYNFKGTKAYNVEVYMVDFSSKITPKFLKGTE